MELPSKNLEATWGITLKIYWWIAWRSFLLTLAGEFIFGTIITIILRIMKVDPFLIQIIITMLVIIMGLLAHLFFLKKLLNKKLKNFTLTVLKNE